MMNKKIAFKPHKTRGQEIIKILEGMGGVNKYNLDGSKGIIAIDNLSTKPITNDWDVVGLWKLGYEIYTLETWEEKINSVPVKMVSIDKVKEWLKYNFGDSFVIDCYGCLTNETEVTTSFDTMEQLLDDFEKTMEMENEYN